MNRLKFKTRIALGFTILLIFSFLIVFLSIFQIRSISKDTDLIYKHPFAVSNSVRDISININAIHRSMKDAVLANNKEQLDNTIELVIGHDSIIEASFKKVKERFLGDSSIIEDTYRDYKAMELIRNEVVTCIKNGEKEKAIEITKQKGAKHVAKLFQKTKILTDFAQNKAEEFHKQTVDARNQSVLLLVIIALTLLILGAVIAIVISNSISKPIRRFIEKIKLIYSDKDDREQDFYTKSEEEILAYTAIELKAAYEKLGQFNTELELNVEKRTKSLKDQIEEYAALSEEYISTNEELVLAKNKAEESDHLKTEFINNMSHEIRTPMNGIIGFSNFLNQPDLSDTKKKYYISIIQNSGDQLMRIIEDILEISRLGTKQVKVQEYEICLNDFLLEHFSIFDIKAKENKTPLYLKNGLSDAKSHIMTDGTKLNKIIGNLLENALKFTTEGYVEFGYKLLEKQIEIYIKDTGIGVDKDKQSMIFERFSQEDRGLTKNVGGLGLGLSIAKENTELLGGEISVVSKKGEGTTFFVRIPYKPSLSSKLKNITAKNKEPISINKILIAEDEEINYLYLETLLKTFDLELEIFHAKNGLEAVEFCKNETDLDLVLMDIKMPIMNGFKATEIIKKQSPNLPIIAQTAYSTTEEKKEAAIAGCDAFISKPISEEALRRVMRKYLVIK